MRLFFFFFFFVQSQGAAILPVGASHPEPPQALGSAGLQGFGGGAVLPGKL